MLRRTLLLLFLCTPAFAKSLHWSAINVDAHLDADGKLRVVERQRIVFDGDWNGGERDFGLRPRQELEIHSIKRVAGASEIELTQGDLSEVDRWDYARPGVVRWRSRLPSDPPFANQEITYVLDATYSKILSAEGGQSYAMAHDFGLPDRAGVIENFTLRLEFDPVWNSEPIVLTRTGLAPGIGVVVDRELTFGGQGQPASVLRVVPRFVPIVALVMALAGALFLALRFAEAERETGRFAALPNRFDDEVLRMPAEVAGAAWDAGVGAPEVAAVLARMSQEGKLSSNVVGKTLHMRLRVPRSTLEGYERQLIDALFSDGSDETDTDSVRTRYKSSGFDPSKLIEPGIEAKLAELPNWNEKVKRFEGRAAALLILGAAVLLGVAAVLGDKPDRVAALIGLFGTLFFSLFASAFAIHQSKTIAGFFGSFFGIAFFMLLAAGPLIICCLFARRFGLHGSVLFALAIYWLTWLKLVLEAGMIRDSRKKIDFRKRIAGARQFFVEQLRLEKPALRDEWFPYVLAFGLGRNVDRWFRAHGTASSHSTSTGSWSSSSSSSSSSGSSWSGGGGAFGGAGATGSWAIAAGAIAAGVAAPSSSGSGGGGGGGGGGSSSGGGGGGGW